MITHDEQKERWDQEHAKPFALTQMDSHEPSNALAPFVVFLEKEGRTRLSGVEMGCGKGRNVIWLAKQPIVSQMNGFDFSTVAIEEARRRALEQGVAEKAVFDVMDATLPWSYDAESFDFGIDCTASVDIESPEGRATAIREMRRVLKKEGLLLVYVMSTDDEYHKELIAKSPAEESNAFIHPQTGKFEKVFSEEELDRMYAEFSLVEARRIPKVTEFFGKPYQCLLHWRVYRK